MNHIEGDLSESIINNGSAEDDELGAGASEPLPNVDRGLHSQSAARAFIERCTRQGISENLCDEMTRPNTASIGTFNRLYPGQPHTLMPPTERWDEGIRILKIASDVTAADPSIRICQVANWYRPEPYNGAVDGSRTSHHRFAQAIDIHYCSRAARNKALEEFQRLKRSNGDIGIGRYRGEGSVIIHLNLRRNSYNI